MTQNVTQKSNSIAFTAFALIALSGVVHIGMGLSEIFGSGGLFDLGVLYLLAGITALGLSGAYFSGKVANKFAYSAAIGLLVLFLLAYVDIHSLKITESVTGMDLHGSSGGHESAGHGDGHNHSHGQESSHNESRAVEDVVSHLGRSVVDLGTKFAETVALVLLVVESVRDD